MRDHETSKKTQATGIQEVPPTLWNVAGWALAVGAFAVATVLSYHEIHHNGTSDLRTPTILLVDALLATVVAFGFAVVDGSLKRWTDVHLCLRFGFWSAAIFRLIPPIMNEEALFYQNLGTIDVEFIVFGACVHGGLVLLLTYPFALRVLDLPVWSSGERFWEMCGSVILVFFIVASIVKLLAANPTFS